MFWFKNIKKIEFDVNDFNVVEKYEDKEENDLSDKINDINKEYDLLPMT
jgi:hypothetical protein